MHGYPSSSSPLATFHTIAALLLFIFTKNLHCREPSMDLSLILLHFIFFLLSSMDFLPILHQGRPSSYVSKKWPKCAKKPNFILLYALCLCFTLSPTSFMLPNHHAPPSIAFLLLINLQRK